VACSSKAGRGGGKEKNWRKHPACTRTSSSPGAQLPGVCRNLGEKKREKREKKPSCESRSLLYSFSVRKNPTWSRGTYSPEGGKKKKKKKEEGKKQTFDRSASTILFRPGGQPVLTFDEDEGRGGEKRKKKKPAQASFQPPQPSYSGVRGTRKEKKRERKKDRFYTASQYSTSALFYQLTL